MKSIRNKILLLAVLPFLAVYTGISVFIYLYLYTSISQSDAWSKIFPALLPIGVSLLIGLIGFSLILVYFSHGIAANLKKLILTISEIIEGNTDLPLSVIKTKDELGMISKSLSRMAEQFRTSKQLQERYYERFNMILQIHYALFRSTGLDEAFDAALKTISDTYSIIKSFMVYLINDAARIVSVFPHTERIEGYGEFFAHEQVMKLLEGKIYVTMNYGSISKIKPSFIGYNTKALGILPLRTENILRGYIILEGTDSEALIHDDKTLIFLIDTLSYILSCKAGWEREMGNSQRINSTERQTYDEELIDTGNIDEFLEKAKNIQNLNIEKGIILIGGEKKKYSELLRVTIKVISEAVQKMRNLHESDLPAFAIEVHSMKGAMYNIGAEALGDEARQLEFAAKSDDSVYCRENYPIFEENLRTFSRNLAALFPQQERNTRTGNKEELTEALVHAKEACVNFDIDTANYLLSPLTYLEWGDEMIHNSLLSIMEDLENLEYEEMGNKISQLLKTLENNNP